MLVIKRENVIFDKNISMGIIKTNTDVTTCAKWDYHFYDNGMKKISNLYRVRPTTKQSGPVLEVRCSNSSASLPFRVVYNCDDLKVDDSGLQSVYIFQKHWFQS